MNLSFGVRVGEEVGFPWDALVWACVSVIYALYCILNNIYANEISDLLVYMVYMFALLSSSLFGYLIIHRMGSE